MPYTVTAPMVVVPDQAGKLHAYHDGGTIAWLPTEIAEHLLGLDMVKKADQQAAPEPGESESNPSTPTTENSQNSPANSGPEKPKRPAQTALKAEWVAYVVDAGLATKDEAEKLDKAAMFALADSE
jgi:heme-binding NEAT domain protein